MNELRADVALLTPVPRQHLLSGLDVCGAEGFVAYGTDAGLVLSELMHIVDDEHPADILFCALQPPDAGTPKATYRGCFVDYDGAIAGRAKAEWLKYRPSSTAGDTAWKSFYLLSDLRALSVPISISTLGKRDDKGKFVKTFKPEGPIIIDTPFR